MTDEPTSFPDNMSPELDAKLRELGERITNGPKGEAITMVMVTELKGLIDKWEQAFETMGFAKDKHEARVQLCLLLVTVTAQSINQLSKNLEL